MYKANNFRSIVSKSGSFMVLCSAQTPDTELEAKGVKGALRESIGFIRFDSRANADGAAISLKALTVTLIPSATSNVCAVVVA